MSIGPMTYENPRYTEFMRRLIGKDGCNFHRTPSGGFTWHCTGDKTHVTTVMQAMGANFQDVVDTLTYMKDHGDKCDCELVIGWIRMQGYLVHQRCERARVRAVNKAHREANRSKGDRP